MKEHLAERDEYLRAAESRTVIWPVCVVHWIDACPERRFRRLQRIFGCQNGAEPRPLKWQQGYVLAKITAAPPEEVGAMPHATELNYAGGLQQLAADLANLRYDAL